MASNCAGCSNPIRDRYYIECTKCRKAYDLVCINITRDTFDKLNEEYKSAWLCPLCFCSRPKVGNTSTPLRACNDVPNVEFYDTYTRPEDSNVNTRRGTELRSNKSRRPEVASASAVPNMQLDISRQLADLRDYFDSKLDTIKKEILEEITVKMNHFEESVQLIKREQELLHTEVVTLHSKLTDLEQENSKLKSNLTELQQTVNDVEQRARLCNLEIFGIPENKAEVLVPMVCRLASVLGIAVNDNDIEYATRLPTRNRSTGLPRTTIVKFRSIRVRDGLLSAARKRRCLTSTDMEIPGNSKPIFINEHLTPWNKALLKATRIRCKELGFQHVWTRNAKIFIRQHGKAPAVRVFDLEQLNKLKK